MKKRMPLFRISTLCLLTIGIISCSSDEEISTDLPGEGDPGSNPHTEITLKAIPSTVSLYNWSEIWISQNHIDGGVPVDSVVWDMPGIFRHVSVPHSSLWMMSQAFCLPGEYVMNATAYHEGDTVSVGSATIFVTDNLNDFLGLRWDSNESIKRGDKHYTSNVDNYSFFLQYVADDQYALLEFVVRVNDDKEFIEANDGSRKLLSDYITKLYGDAKNVYEGEDITQSPLMADYDELFSKKLNTIYPRTQFYPLAIWQTRSSNIALIGYIEDMYPCTIFMVIAEPRAK
ncbi:hypothetical protein GGR21_002886 [Dysgonomonas hofstadii]|uniref:Lipoprotein n=1 Tax=Dysgonomonas hofstadii TaxID=637886 RepID=A0A840CX02_9BACT|nr:hypothetical protein [Dysgonomonas hofstadii]MBB4036972.1 hypothetical protein [Dysgonomonas hofstadii]